MVSEIEEIKSRLNIVDVISSYIKLEKSGVNYRARCPFHSEKTPSFFVSPSKQIWHCFGGCNEGGDIFKFVMKIEGIEFADALRLLANKAGVELKTRPDWQKAKTERQTLSEICDLACQFFEVQLEKSKTGNEAKEYLIKRGLKEETIKDWKLGFSPNIWQGLSDFLVGKGFKRQDIVKAGLAIEKENDKFFDRFRSRIMFPIFGFNGEVVGFTGRIFGKAEEGESKYMNTPNTLLYDKSRALYGIDKAKMEIRKKDNCVLVEGNVDCIMSHEAGIKNCVAVSGTALTPMHLNIIKRYSPNLVLAFDTDEAGIKATKKALTMGLKQDFEVKMIELSSEKDPADIVLNEGFAKWQEMIDKATPAVSFFFSLALKSRNKDSIEDKKKIIKDFLPVLKKIENNVEQSHWLEKLSKELKVKDSDLRSEMLRIKLEEEEDYEVALDFCPKETKKGRKELLEEEILALVFLKNEKINELIEEQINDFFYYVKEIVLKIKEMNKVDEKELLEFFKENDELSNFLNYILLRAEIMKDSELDIDQEFKICLNEINSLKLRKQRNELTSEIKDLESKGEFDKLSILLEKFNNLTKNNNYEEKEKENYKEEENCQEKDCQKEKEDNQEKDKEGN